MIVGVTTRSMLHRIAAKGYAVSLKRQDGKVCAEAISMTDPSQRHISRSYDGDGKDETRRAVESLAVMVGLQINDWDQT